jgi:hypothetical protein
MSMSRAGGGGESGGGVGGGGVVPKFCRERKQAKRGLPYRYSFYARNSLRGFSKSDRYHSMFLIDWSGFSKHALYHSVCFESLLCTIACVLLGWLAVSKPALYDCVCFIRLERVFKASAVS